MCFRARLTLASGATALGSVLNVWLIVLIFDGSLGVLVYQTDTLPAVPALAFPHLCLLCGPLRLGALGRLDTTVGHAEEIFQSRTHEPAIHLKVFWTHA
jgi:hypothetical protein